MIIVLLYQSIELRHRLRLDGVHDVDVRSHCLVVVVTGPLHDDVRRDTKGKGIDDEGSTPGMGPDQLIFGMAFFNTFVSFIGDNVDLFVDSSQLA